MAADAGNLLVGEEVSLSPGPLVAQLISVCKDAAHRTFMEDSSSGRAVTFGELLSDAGGISSALRALGQKPGKIVTIISDPTIESTKFIFGTWISGAAASCINPNLPIDEMRYGVEQCRSKVIYCDPERRDAVVRGMEGLPWGTRIISPAGEEPLLDFFSCLLEDSDGGLQWEGYWTGPDHALSVLFTSGTTGAPKGVIIRDQAVRFNMNLRTLFWTENTRFLQTTPMYWISYNLVVNICIATGCTMILAYKMSPDQLLKIITVYKPTEWFSGPAALLDLCRVENLEEYDTSSLVGLNVGGSIVLPEHRSFIINKLVGNRNVVRAMYGSTEAGMITYDKEFVAEGSPHFASVGQPAMGVTIKVVDTDNGKIVPPHTPGEICVKSPGVLKQYLNRPLTGKEIDSDGFWHMGDLGYYDEDGYLYYKSRLKDLMKFRGQQIAPAELETIIHMHPEVIESCVVGKPCAEQGGDLPAAFVVRKENSSLTEEQLFDFVAGKVIDEKKLRGGIYFVDTLPRSDVGKILRWILQDKLIASKIVI